MANTNLVRPSRDGDQFHYLWAARRCLNLLSTNSGLVAVSIEGPSLEEQPGALSIEAGEELIDVAEYFGSEDFARAHLVRYMQLKHSTLHANDAWTASGLKKTISGFAKRYGELKKAHPQTDLTDKLEFWFVTNRSISADITEAVIDAATSAAPRHPTELTKLQKFTSLAGSELAAFCGLLRFEDRQDGYWDQRNILFQEVNGYLPDADVDAPMLLKELVTRRALSESELNPTITKIDVLRALKTDERSLFPAANLIAQIHNAVTREQENQIIDQIVRATGPIIVHASGGVGKSVFAARIDGNLPQGSICVLYDCFGNGQYRSAANYRHRHKDALVQAANELATRGLCHPLIPTPNADAGAYVRAFTYRLNQAAEILRARNKNAILCVVVDAADNAQMVAEEISEPRSFVRDLIRIDVPQGVRLVFLCRSHRQHLLGPPFGAISVELLPFSQRETAAFLLKAFPNATEQDINEFHRLSSQNPRVQALALSRGLSLQETLRLLGPNPTSVEDTISVLLENAIEKLKDASGSIEKDRIEKICAGIATLRPLIPITVLSSMSGVEQGAIKSFAYDIGRPLRVSGETIQFLDEPAETWFRDKFKPNSQAFSGFIAVLKPLARGSAYVASMLPQLMLEAGQFSELVELALSSAALPEGSPLEKRDVELQRLQFALKAGLRAQHYLASAKLALKAGGETAGDDRQRKLLQDNTDLVSAFLELDRIQEIVSRRTFGSGWVGSHHAYEAALLSGRKELTGDARSRLRMANEWLQNWSQLTADERKNEEISDQDIVELTLAHLNIHGPADAVKNLRRWRPREVSYRVGRVVTRRLIDHGRWPDIEEMARAAGNNLCLVLAVAVEVREVDKVPPNDVTKRALRQLTRHLIKKNDRTWDDSETVLDAVTSLIEAALKADLCTHNEAAKILSKYLPTEPPRRLASRFSKARFPLLRAYCLRAALQGNPIELTDVAHDELKKDIEKKNQHSTSRELQEFQEDIGTLLPWHKLWASVLLGNVMKDRISGEIKNTTEVSNKAARNYYREESYTVNEMSLLWMDILHKSDETDTAALASFNRWKDKLKQPLFTPTLNALCRLCAQREETKLAALAFSLESYTITKEDRSDAEIKSAGYLEVSRAIITTSKEDAKAYFNEAVEVAGKIGDENLARWDAILDLASRASRADRPVSKIAYQFSRCAELTYEYVVKDKHFPWNQTVAELCGLCPSSAITILSRWRDRAFGWHERLLPLAVENLVQKEVIDPRDAIPLTGFRAQWNFDALLGFYLSKCHDRTQKPLASHLLWHRAKFSIFTSSALNKFQAVAAKYRVTLDGIADAIAAAEREEAAEKRNQFDYSRTTPESREDAPSPWDEIFANKDLASGIGISAAYKAFKKTEPPWSHETFFTEALRRVPIGNEIDFIGGVLELPEFDLYNFRTFLEQLPENWKGRPAISHALANSLRVICHRYCAEVRKSRYYEALPFELASSLTGVSQSEIVDIVLDALGETSELIDADRLFSLVGLLVVKLSHDEALNALSYGLELFNPILEIKDGDGPWNDRLSPPDDVRQAIAGYIWSALAAPEAVLRWEASHTVVELCRLNRREIIHHLMTLAAMKRGGPFVDGGLPFYELHAQQWLLIGLARAAIEAPVVVAAHSAQLIDWALNDSPHVLIKQFAARALLQLIASGHLADQKGLADNLRNVNKALLPPVKPNNYNGKVSLKHNQEVDDDKFYFGIDVGPYWYNPLGRVFAMSQGDIETSALKIIRNDFFYDGKGYWNEDERTRRNLYHEQHTSHSHGSNPRTDNLHFYHAYHAMMIVAGNLLSTMPIQRNADYDNEDEFADWLSRHDLTRQDNRWLWDRRDSEPPTRGAWVGRGKEHPDHRRVLDADFEEALRTGDWLNLWGYWTEADSHREQSMSVHSALVTPHKSEALLRALATTNDVYAYGIPSADSDMEISRPGFELKGWVLDSKRSKQLDEYDRWAGDVGFPPPRPAPFIVKRLGIETDSDLRFWRDQNATYVLESKLWGYYDEANRHESTNPNRGSRLQASLSFITSMLTELGLDLIIEVKIERRRRYKSYENGKDDDERIKAIAKFFHIDRNGNLRTCK